jgi:hypothetical protein
MRERKARSVVSPNEKLTDNRDRCVRSYCEAVGVDCDEVERMVKLLGKTAARHEIETNIRGRPHRIR